LEVGVAGVAARGSPSGALEGSVEGRGEVPEVAVAEVGDGVKRGGQGGGSFLEAVPREVVGGVGPREAFYLAAKILDDEAVGGGAGTDGGALKVVEVAVVDPVIWAARFPASGVNPVDGAGDGPEGSDVLEAFGVGVQAA
jgi:hypothetical protein